MLSEMELLVVTISLRSVSQKDREVRDGRVETGKSQPYDSEEQNGKADPDRVFGRHCVGARPVEQVVRSWLFGSFVRRFCS